MPDQMPNQSDIEFLMPQLTAYARENPVVVEIGCGLGNGSTRAFAQGIREAIQAGKDPKEVLLVSVDIDPERPKECPPEPWWRKVTGRSESFSTWMEVIQIMHGLGHRWPKLIFIDTEHSKEQIQAELVVWKGLARPETIWLFHDTWMFNVYNPMTDTIKSYAQKHGLVYEDLTRESHGLGKMSKEETEETESK